MKKEAVMFFAVFCFIASAAYAQYACAPDHDLFPHIADCKANGHDFALDYNDSGCRVVTCLNDTVTNDSCISTSERFAQETNCRNLGMNTKQVYRAIGLNYFTCIYVVCVPNATIQNTVQEILENNETAETAQAAQEVNEQPANQPPAVQTLPETPSVESPAPVKLSWWQSLWQSILGFFGIKP